MGLFNSNTTFFFLKPEAVIEFQILLILGNVFFFYKHSFLYLFLFYTTANEW